MSATFATPIAAALLAVELLLFEWKPRSAIPVALASATAGAARRYILGLGPLFPVPHHAIFIGPLGFWMCPRRPAGRRPLRAPHHWCLRRRRRVPEAADPLMWWPAIGGLAVGLGGMVFPQALGVGYDTIQVLLQAMCRAP